MKESKFELNKIYKDSIIEHLCAIFLYIDHCRYKTDTMIIHKKAPRITVQNFTTPFISYMLL